MTRRLLREPDNLAGHSGIAWEDVLPAGASVTGIPSKLAYTIAEVGELLGLCRATVYKLIGDGQLRTIYLSERAPRVLHEEVVAFLQRKQDEAQERSEFIRSRLGARF